MVMLLILVLLTLVTAYGIVQTKRQGNVFGMAFSTVAFLVFLFCTGLALTI